MTYKNDKTNHRPMLVLGIALMLVTPSVGMNLLQISGSAAAVLLEPRLPDPPQLTQIEKDQIINTALNAEGVKRWSATGWEVSSMGFAGSIEPTIVWDTVDVVLRLPNSKGNAPISCPTGFDATVIMDLKTHKILEARIPTMDSCKGGFNGEGPVPEDVTKKASLPSFIPSAAGITPAYLIAEENDVSGGLLRSNLAWLNTPSFNSAIYTKMDRHIEQFLNQKWNNDAFTQEGWDITHQSPCPSCGYTADSSAIVWVDTSVTGTFENHRVNDPLMVYDGSANLSLQVQSTCNYPSPTNYKTQFAYNGRVWQHDTLVPCTAILKSSDIKNNSVFVENLNTVSSGTWASQITGTIKGWSAKELTTAGVLQNWVTSDKLYRTCTGIEGTPTSSNMTGTLASAGTATWLVSTMIRAC